MPAASIYTSLLPRFLPYPLFYKYNCKYKYIRSRHSKNINTPLLYCHIYLAINLVVGGELIYPKLPKTKKTQCYQTFSGAVLCIKAGENFEFGERWCLTPCTWGLKIWKSPLKIEISKLFYHRHVGCLSRGIEGTCSKITFFSHLALAVLEKSLKNHFFSDYFQNRAFLAVFETFLKNG